MTSKISSKRNSKSSNISNYRELKKNKYHRNSANIFINNYSSYENSPHYNNSSMESTGDNFRSFQRNNTNLTFGFVKIKKKNNPIKPKHHLINNDDFSLLNTTNRTNFRNNKKNSSFMGLNRNDKKRIGKKIKIFKTNKSLINLAELNEDKKIDINLSNYEIVVPHKTNNSDLFHKNDINFVQEQETNQESKLINSSQRNSNNQSDDSSNYDSGFILNKKNNRKMINLKLLKPKNHKLKNQRFSVQDSLSQSNNSNNKILVNRNSVQYISNQNRNNIFSSNDNSENYLNNNYMINDINLNHNEKKEDKIFRFYTPKKEKEKKNKITRKKTHYNPSSKKKKSILNSNNELIHFVSYDDNEENNENEIVIKKTKSKTTYIKEKDDFMSRLKKWTKNAKFKNSHFYKLFHIDDNGLEKEEQTPKQIQDLKKGLLNFTSYSSFNPRKKSSFSHVSFNEINSNPEIINSYNEINSNYSSKNNNNNNTNNDNNDNKRYSNIFRTQKKKVNKKFVKQLSRIPEILNGTERKRKSINTPQKISKSTTKLQMNIESENEEENESKKCTNKSLPKIDNTEQIFDKFINQHKYCFLEERDSDYESFSSSSDNNSLKKSKSKYSKSSFGFFDIRANSVRVSMRDNKLVFENKFLKEIGLKFVEKLKEENENLLEDIDLCCNNFKDNLVNNIIKSKNKIMLDVEKKYEENLNIIFLKKKKGEYDKDKKKIFRNYIYSPKLQNKVNIYMDLQILKLLITFYIQNFLFYFLKFDLNEKYFEINLYEQIYKLNYLSNELNKNNEITIFTNFGKNQNQKVRFSQTKLKKINFQIYRIDKISAKYYNKFLICDGGISEFESLNLLSQKEFLFPFEIELKSQLTSQNFKKLRLTSKNYSKKIGTYKNFQRSNTNQNTSILFRNGKIGNKNQKVDIWKKTFFKRTRDIEANNKILFEIKKEKKLKEKLRKQIDKKLYTSPLQQDNSFLLINRNHSRKLFNKESILFQTHIIKSNILKKYSNYLETLFFYVKDNNFQSFKELFCKFKINPEIKDEEGNSLLNLAVQCGSNEIIEFLLSRSALPNSQNKKLNTPLHYALTYQNFKLADLLIRNGADENIKNRDGLGPWQCLNSKHSII